MSELDTLRAERKRAQEEGEAIMAAAPKDEKGQEQLDAEQGKTLRALSEKIGSLTEQIREAEAIEAARDEFRTASSEDLDPKPVMYGGDKDPAKMRAKNESGLTPGEQFIASEAYRAFMAQFPDQKRVPSNYTGEAAVLPNGARGLLGLRTATELARFRTLITSSDTSAGDLVRPDYRGLIEPGLWAPTGLVNLVTVIPTQSDSIQYVKETSHTEAAASVEEATAATGSSGLKPEGGLVFDVVTDNVSTFAVWVPATKRILADANGLAAYINQYLANDLRRELEDQMINGAGAGDDFTGLLNAGIDTEAAGEGPFYAIRMAKAAIRTNARTTPTTILANPTNVAEWDLAEVAAETNRFVAAPSAPFSGGTSTIWGMRVVESEFIAEGTCIVGDFRYAVLYDRESTTLSVGTIDDDFVRNIVRVLAEMRAGFGVIRPAAFSAVTV